MGEICIKKAFIENYKCFEEQAFNFSVPDGATAGSGLNILIGENGNGKTALLESINYATQNSYASENRLRINDFNDYSKPIRINIDTIEFCCKMSAPYMGCSFDCCGIEFNARNRDRKSSGKLLSSPFSVNTSFKPKTPTYKKKNGDDSGKEIPPLQKMYSNKNIDGAELNVFYFDKNRTRQLSAGTYKTTYERICDDLNWKFIKNLKDKNIEQLLNNVVGEYFSNVLSIAQKGTGSKLADEMATFFGQEQYKNLGIDLIDLLHPFNNSFFTIRSEGELSQILPRDLGSGIEIILTFLLLRNISSASKGSIVYLLDEPELHLHPKAQRKLVSLLFEESKTKQIFISTHSPYLIKGCMVPEVNKIVLLRDNNGDIKVENADSLGWGIFPWSPSWGEVNFIAYNLATVDYHNELYGWLQEKYKLNTEKDVEAYLNQKGISKTKSWIRVKNGSPQTPYPITLCSYIRNTIHHPENSQNQTYTEDELIESIEILRSII